MYHLKKFNVTSGKYRKLFSSVAKVIDVSTDDKTNITRVYLQRPPVNSLNSHLLTEISYIMDDLEKTKCKGLVLTSNIVNIFSAGLDLTEFYKTDIQKLSNFWTTLQNTWLKLYTATFPTVALINGHSPAAGCLLALSCDYRIMLSPHYTIGFNEAKIGIPAPFWFIEVMQSIIGSRKTELSVLTGQMYKTDEALAIGLIDETAINLTEAESKVNSFFKNIIAFPGKSRSLMKKDCRDHIVQKFLLKKDEERELVIEFIMNPKTQKNIELYFKALQNKV
ncbi:hypothetical protein PGB90_005388 [Kerria lacca]